MQVRDAATEMSNERAAALINFAFLSWKKPEAGKEAGCEANDDPWLKAEYFDEWLRRENGEKPVDLPGIATGRNAVVLLHRPTAGENNKTNQQPEEICLPAQLANQVA